MNIRFVLHSTTGNTRIVTRYAAARLRAAGHDCAIHDIVRHPGWKGHLSRPHPVDASAVRAAPGTEGPMS